jgi:hypothetical protein
LFEFKGARIYWPSFDIQSLTRFHLQNRPSSHFFSTLHPGYKPFFSLKKVFMKLFVKGLAAAALACALGACGGGEKAEEAKMEEAENVNGVLDGVGRLSDMAKNLEEAGKTSEARLKARRERGDTVVIGYQELAKYLPEVSGYQHEGEPSGETSNAMGFGVSTAKQRYVNGSKYVEISLLDYNSMSGAGAAALAGFAFAAEVSSESNEEKVVGFKKSADIKGSQVFRKKDKYAMLTAIVTDRFMITISANEQEDLEFIKQVFESFDLNKLASL